MITSVLPAGHVNFLPPRCARNADGANSGAIPFRLHAPASRELSSFQGAINSTFCSAVSSTLLRVAYPLSAIPRSGNSPQFSFTFSNAGISSWVSFAAVVTPTPTIMRDRTGVCTVGIPSAARRQEVDVPGGQDAGDH